MPKVEARRRARVLPLSGVILNSAAGQMLETPWIRRYHESGDNASGAVNQQERPASNAMTRRPIHVGDVIE